MRIRNHWVVLVGSLLIAFLLAFFLFPSNQHDDTATLPLVIIAGAFVTGLVGVALTFGAKLAMIHLERRTLGDSSDVPKQFRDAATRQAFQCGYYRRCASMEIYLDDVESGKRNFEFSSSSTIVSFKKIEMHVPKIEFPEEQRKSEYRKGTRTIVLKNPRPVYCHDGNEVAPSDGGILLGKGMEKAECLRILAKATMPENCQVIEDDHKWSSPVNGGFTLKARLPIGYMMSIYVSSGSDEILTWLPEERSESGQVVEYVFKYPGLLFAYQRIGWCISRVSASGSIE